MACSKHNECDIRRQQADISLIFAFAEGCSASFGGVSASPSKYKMGNSMIRPACTRASTAQNTTQTSGRGPWLFGPQGHAAKAAGASKYPAQCCLSVRSIWDWHGDHGKQLWQLILRWDGVPQLMSCQLMFAPTRQGLAARSSPGLDVMPFKGGKCQARCSKPGTRSWVKL